MYFMARGGSVSRAMFVVVRGPRSRSRISSGDSTARMPQPVCNSPAAAVDLAISRPYSLNLATSWTHDGLSVPAWQSFPVRGSHQLMGKCVAGAHEEVS